METDRNRGVMRSCFLCAEIICVHFLREIKHNISRSINYTFYYFRCFAAIVYGVPVFIPIRKKYPAYFICNVTALNRELGHYHCYANVGDIPDSFQGVLRLPVYIDAMNTTNKICYNQGGKANESRNTGTERRKGPQSSSD